MAGTSLFAPHPTIANLWVALTDQQDSNLIVLARCTGSPDTTANVYSHGAIMIQTDSGTGNKAIYENVGSSAVPSWNLIGSIVASEITLANGSILVGNASGIAAAQRQYGAVTVNATNTAGSLFGTSAFSGSLTGLVFTTGPQGVSGTVTVKNGSTTIATMTSKTGAGSLTGSSISETAFAHAADLSVVTSGSTIDGALLATFISGSST